jgi:hypothetical protein
MMQQLKMLRFRKVILLMSLCLFTSVLFAQPETQSGQTETTTTTTRTSTEKTDVDLTVSGDDTWYTQPWVWIAGAAVFILLLVALLSGGRKDRVRSERIVVKKTEDRDGDFDSRTTT